MKCFFYFSSNLLSKNKFNINKTTKNLLNNLSDIIISEFVIMLLIWTILMFLLLTFKPIKIIKINHRVLKYILENDPIILIENSLIYIESEMYSPYPTKIQQAIFLDKSQIKPMKHDELIDFFRKNPDITEKVSKLLPLYVLEYSYLSITSQVLKEYMEKERKSRKKNAKNKS